MKLEILTLFIIFSLGAVHLPNSSGILENGQYTLEANGFIVSQRSIEKSEIFMNFKISESAVGKKFELKNGLFTIKEEQFQISPNIQSRLLKEGDLIRLSGLVSNGDRFTILGKNAEESKGGLVYSIIGILISENDVRKKIVYSGMITNKIKTVQPELKEEKTIDKKEFKIISSHTSIREIKQTYEIKIRAYESEVNPPSDFSLNRGVLDGVSIVVNIADSNGKIIKEFSGNTDSQGYFIDNFRIPTNLREGKYFVNISAELNGIVIYDQLILFITEIDEN